MLKRVSFFLLFLCIYATGYTQKITPNGYFLKDSVQIGEPLPYVISIQYPKELEIIFPDSLHNFSPFELSEKEYFPTKSDSVFSRDSAIYYLSTFEIDTVQYLKMPVYLINEFDSTILYTSIDSIILRHVVSSIPDSVAMITNTEYVDVPMAFNYPYTIIGLVISLVILIIIWLVFGKKIKNRIIIYALKKRNLKFVQSFDQLVISDRLDAEKILTIWKAYLEKLMDQPFTKLTTKEITSIIQHDEVGISLINIDKNIYGPKDESLLDAAYGTIKEMAISTYNDKVNQIING